MDFRVRLYNELTVESKTVRNTVFVEEQGFVDEFDETDAIAWHVVIYNGDKPLATGRVFPDSPDVYHIGRVAVIKEYRSRGVGRMVMNALEEKAKGLGAKAVTLSAQCQAEGFYTAIGYESTGEYTVEQDCPHVTMTKML